MLTINYMLNLADDMKLCYCSKQKVVLLKIKITQYPLKVDLNEESCKMQRRLVIQS